MTKEINFYGIVDKDGNLLKEQSYHGHYMPCIFTNKKDANKSCENKEESVIKLRVEPYLNKKTIDKEEIAIMEFWKEEALRRIDIAAEEAKCRVLSIPDGVYNRVYGEIDIWLCRDEASGCTSVKLYYRI